MIDICAILAVPLAGFIRRMRKNKIPAKCVLVLLLAGLPLFNQFERIQYRTSLLHWDSMTKEAYRGIFFKKHWPEGYDKMIKPPDCDKAMKGESESPR